MNQLTSFQRGTLNGTKDGLTGSASRSQAWDFDALGNFDSQTTDGTGQTRGHNQQNEITSVQNATTPTYDANGNLTTDETGRTFTYDAWNRLVEVRDSGSNLLATYRYDGLSRKAREIRGSTTTDLYYSTAWQVLEERVGGAVQSSYVWSPVYVDALIARDRDTDGNGSLDERLYAVQDANWNVTALLDTSGNVVERYAYDPFGGFAVLDASWGSRSGSSYAWKYQHQGLKWDADLGALDDRNRVLSVTLGRFFQRDPIGFGGGEVDLYRFVDNSPTNLLDPWGLGKFKWLVQVVELVKGKCIKPTGEVVKPGEAPGLLIGGDNLLFPGKHQAEEAARIGGDGLPPVWDRGHPLPGGGTGKPHYHLNGRPPGAGHAFYSCEGLLVLISPISIADDLLDVADFLCGLQPPRVSPGVQVNPGPGAGFELEAGVRGLNIDSIPR